MRNVVETVKVKVVLNPLLPMKILLLLPPSASQSAHWPAKSPSRFPRKRPRFKPGKGVELARPIAVMCHSAEYISTQPPMPRKFWEANVKEDDREIRRADSA